MSNLEEKAARYYAKGWWSLANLEALVEKGKLTEDAVRSITGCDEPEPEEGGEE